MTNQGKKDLWNAVLAWQSRGCSEREVVKHLKYLGHASSTTRTYYRAVALSRMRQAHKVRASELAQSRGVSEDCEIISEPVQ